MLALLLAHAFAASAPPTTSLPASATATLALQDVLPLFSSAAEAPPVPPVPALVVRSALKGHLSERDLIVDAHFDVDVLGDRWARVPLLEAGANVFLTQVPDLMNATVAVHHGQLCLLTRTPGHYKVDAQLAVRGEPSAGLRKAALAKPADVPSTALHLEVDPNVFSLVGDGADGQPILPRQGQWTVTWTSNAREASASRRVRRPPLEPAIPKASASWVSTLEGKARLKVRYALKLDRPQPLEVLLPTGLQLVRVTLNGEPLAVQPDGGVLKLTAAPASVGASDGTLELTLAQDFGVFHLSGRLGLALPMTSWPIAEISADAFLPAVFNYRRQGGSLEQVEHEGEGTSQDPDLPGKPLHFRQFLVAASAPSLELGYSVDMTKSYFH